MPSLNADVLLLICELLAQDINDLGWGGRGWSCLKSLASLARTNRAFNDLAVDYLWANQNSLGPFLSTFPDNLFDIGLENSETTSSPTPFVILKRPPLSTDWERPLFYAHRIRRVSVGPYFQRAKFGEPALHHTTTYTLLASCPTQLLLPNLTGLIAHGQNWGSEDHFNAFYFCLQKLVHSKLCTLDFAGSISSVNIDSAISFALHICSSLEKLIIRVDGHYGRTDVPNFPSHIHLPHTLRQLEIGRKLVLSADAVADLGALQNLSSLHLLCTDVDRCPPHSPGPTGSAVDRFAGLQKLMQHATSLKTCDVLMSCITSNKLESLNFFVMEPQSAVSLHSTLASLGRRARGARKLRSLAISLPLPLQVSNSSHTPSILLPLLSPFFNDLITLRIELRESEYHLPVIPLDLALIPVALPRIEVLDLEYIRNAQSSTLETVVFLARRCRLLRILGLDFNARVSPTSMGDDGIAVPVALEVLKVGDSSIEDPASIAAFLSQRFSRLKRVMANEMSYYEMEWRQVSDSISGEVKDLKQKVYVRALRP
ncbi:hypothetical protein BV22DRAFT_1129569 [Leucogyrophana mollusca]|uniref:Uncharacterized protein n=1 Tax=Leucogyrophana mollusca TaxID=85980 RepID=A0ACB8BGP4_9AGAM|nr:hypothetical protein BV22DRAFT_1129569 [Leucogyrophana mollusca]